MTPKVSCFLTEIAEFRDGSGGASQEALPISGIKPRSGYDPRAIAWADLVLVGVHQGIERLPIHDALVHQERFEGPDPQR